MNLSFFNRFLRNTAKRDYFKRGYFKRRKSSREIDPDEVLLDSSNIPEYDTAQMEGRLEKPISRSMLFSIMIIFVLMAGTFILQAIKMQIVNGSEYKARSENNILRPVPLFAGRGIIYDRNNLMLTWNTPGQNVEDPNTDRKYATSTGLAHILGYVQYPSKDDNGFYYQEDFIGVTGVEKYFNEILSGTAGSRLVEVDAKGKVISESVVRPPVQGKNITLSIDSRVQSAVYRNLKDIAERVGFSGGAGVIIDVRNGEIIAMTSYPEYNSQVMSDKIDQKAVRSMLNNPGLLFLNRAIDGLYTPGSIVKPYVAIGALNEDIIDPSTVIVTTGSISIPNPYDDTKSTLFRDWKNHGSVDMKHALAVSSDAYFYVIGGGYKDQKGLGIINIDKYLKMFGFGTTTMDGSDSLLLKKAGTIPTPEWKKKTFNEDWYIGDTYHTAIGQYGFQVTPLQIARALAAIANNGKLLSPTIIKDSVPHVESVITIPEKDFKVIHEGMRLSTQIGTSVALNVPYVKIASKSGTAELGVSKANVNSWITGFWPYENPKYAFVLLLEHGSVHNLIGAAAAMRQTLDWMSVNTPEYFRD
ncbi:MAG: penicillin-binding transpeptidase domain-containing protein [Candidatus Paceibacterota bacterium]|jgi:penicillin-binding protein 2